MANIYYLLCYAWDALEEKQAFADVDALESTQLVDLFARVLVSGTRRLLRRGVDRGYLPNQGEIPGIRGRVLVSRTLSRDLIRRGLADCAWDELEYDTVPNQILKTSLCRLHDSGALDRKLRSEVGDILRWLSPVRTIDLRSFHFRRVQLHRNNRIYRMLLHVCEFIHEHWLPAEEGSRGRFADFERKGLHSVFEKFVFNFYRRELPGGWSVSAPVFAWDSVSRNRDADELLPVMKTDVCLQGPGRAIILDTKFYANALKAGPYGGNRLSPQNLYQLFTYLRQRSSEPGWEQAEGVLLYPRTSRDFDARFATHGHPVRALTLDLTGPWQAIHARLLAIVDLPDVTPNAESHPCLP